MIFPGQEVGLRVITLGEFIRAVPTINKVIADIGGFPKNTALPGAANIFFTSA
jgi:hypothetical protein